jgi:hypothetical protein
MLKEVNGTLLKGTYTRNRLKKFVYKGGTFIPVKQEVKTDSIVPSILKEDNSWEEDLTKDKELLYTTRNT